MDYNQLNKDELINIIKTLEKSSNDKSRDIFISNISHDVRTLLNAIYGHAQILCNDSLLNEEQKRSVDKIIDSSGHMIDLINDIINISKNVGTERLCFLEFNLNDFLKNIYHIFESSIDKNKIEFILNNEINEQAVIKTDKNKLFYILLNLLGNAVKFTKQGFIKIECKPISNKSILFEIIDSGIGIDEKSILKIFNNYKKGENNSLSTGDGLGLGIAKKNASLLGGNLEVESQKGKGSKFYFNIKCENLKQEFLSIKKDIFELKQIKKLKKNQDFFVLIAEKDDTQKSILESYLLSKKIPFKIFSSLSLIKKYFEKNPVDMLFLNTNFGINECEEFVLNLRKIGIHIPIVALTVSVMSNELRRINNTFTTYIISPYNFLDIDQTLILFSNKEFDFQEEKIEEEKSKKLIIKNIIKEDIIKYANLGQYDKLQILIKKISHKETKKVLDEYLDSYDFDSIIKKVGE